MVVRSSARSRCSCAFSTRRRCSRSGWSASVVATRAMSSLSCASASSTRASIPSGRAWMLELLELACERGAALAGRSFRGAGVVELLRQRALMLRGLAQRVAQPFALRARLRQLLRQPRRNRLQQRGLRGLDDRVDGATRVGARGEPRELLVAVLEHGVDARREPGDVDRPAVAEVAQLGPDRGQRRLALGALDAQPEARVGDDVRERAGGCIEQAVEGEQRARAAPAARVPPRRGSAARARAISRARKARGVPARRRPRPAVARAARSPPRIPRLPGARARRAPSARAAARAGARARPGRTRRRPARPLRRPARGRRRARASARAGARASPSGFRAWRAGAR